MTPKQKLILFLIYSDPGVKSIYGLVKQFDRADFPGKVGIEIKVLIEIGLIKVSTYFDNGTESDYEVTEQGTKFIKENFNSDEILEYISHMPNPDFLYKLTQKYIEKGHNLQQGI